MPLYICENEEIRHIFAGIYIYIYVYIYIGLIYQYLKASYKGGSRPESRHMLAGQTAEDQVDISNLAAGTQVLALVYEAFSY